MEKVCNEKVKVFVLESDLAQYQHIIENVGKDVEPLGDDVWVKCGSLNPNDEYGDDDLVFCDKCYMEKNPGWEKTGWRPHLFCAKPAPKEREAA